MRSIFFPFVILAVAFGGMLEIGYFLQGEELNMQYVLQFLTLGVLVLILVESFALHDDLKELLKK